MAEYSYDRDWKLRVIVAEDLSCGQKIAQAMHAAIEFTQRYPELTANWYHKSNSVVILEYHDLTEFKSLLTNKQVIHCEFYEPDMNNRLTALALEPTAISRELTARLKLAGKHETRALD